MHDTISLLRELNAHDFTSGAEIAQRLAISRASVSLGLAKAEAYGVHLVRRHGVGYRLEQPIDWLEQALIQGYLQPSSIANIVVSNTLGSTNRQLLLDPQHGKLLVTEWQDGGRGRLGRPWMGVLGGSLLFSLAWRFDGGSAQLAGLPLAVGVAVASVLRQAGVAAIGLKWPNDLLLQLDGQQWAKVGGILIEMQGDALGPSHVVIGIGLNIALPAQAQNQLDQVAASLVPAGLNCGRNELLARLMNQLETTLSQFAQSGFSSIRPQWEALHAWPTELLNAIAPNGQIKTGYFAGLSVDGSLRLNTPDGECLIHTGDVSLRRAI
ncbi:biotin--[acetyl-CoA-carboxylase] ligase [Deefgea piscis]|uniref:biotin--[acetyl-CoA-carboxylase] ligase n=1 Tax=Deefgea piscis TaxID=2739061 RepID=UPI001C82688C|nr:biotin--[acetyl-CoA-carboxylase] ligase [Deefgea piscis]QZA81991.1 biotin--[acetyl-CoA-carboxylase] ligase [Deefgea piscis]